MSAPHPGEIAAAAAAERQPKARKAKTGKSRPQVTDVTSARAEQNGDSKDE